MYARKTTVLILFILCNAGALGQDRECPNMHIHDPCVSLFAFLIGSQPKEDLLFILLLPVSRPPINNQLTKLLLSSRAN